MPVTVSYDLPAGEIKKGNYLYGEKVVGTRPKRVNTTIVLENPVGGRTEWPFKLTDMLEVGVDVLTPEELEEKRLKDLEWEHEYLVQWIDKQIASVEGSVEKAISEIKPEWVRYSDLNGVIYADAYRRIYSQFCDFMERAREQKLHKAHVDGGDCVYATESESGSRMCVKPTVPTTAYDGAVMCVQWLADMLGTSAMHFRASSRSTSVMSNYMDDVYLEALSKVASDLKYAVGSELRDVLPKGW